MSTSETINIKKIYADDVLLLQSIGRQTFKETFADGNTEENMRKYLEEGFSIETFDASHNKILVVPFHCPRVERCINTNPLQKKRISILV